MRKRRLFKKNEYLGLRLPTADKDKLEEVARREKRNPSDLAWVLICDGLERLDKLESVKRAQEQR